MRGNVPFCALTLTTKRNAIARASGGIVEPPLAPIDAWGSSTYGMSALREGAPNDASVEETQDDEQGGGRGRSLLRLCTTSGTLREQTLALAREQR